MTIVTYDAVIVLNGGADKHGQLFQDTKNRVLKALEVSARYGVRTIIMVGHESKEMREYALANTPAKDLDILVEDHSHNTVENAHFVKTKYLTPKHWRSVIVVTEKFHAHRSKITFELVLGDEYHIKMIASRANYSAAQRADLAKQEVFYLDLTRTKLAHIKPHDDAKRQAMLEEKREVTTDYFPAVRV